MTGASGSSLGEFGGRFLSSETAKSIPILGSILNLKSDINDVRDRIFIEKLLKFLEFPDLVLKADKDKYVAKLLTSREEVSSFATKLVQILERISDIEKPRLISYVFIAFLDRVIDETLLRRLTEAIADAYADDLKVLLGYGTPSPMPKSMHLRYLQRTGLTEFEVSKIIDNAGDVEYIVSDLGLILVKVYKHVETEYRDAFDRTNPS